MAVAMLAITLDCADARRVGTFWAGALGRQLGSDDRGWTWLEPTEGQPQVMAFQPVPEAKDGKNRMHLDLQPASSSSVEEEVARLEGLGARRLGPMHQAGHLIMADPEGNEFCVVP